MRLHIGDRFELPATQEAWRSGQIPLSGGFRHLVDATGEPIPVTLRGESGQSVVGVWDGGGGLLDVPGLGELVFVTGTSGRLALQVEEVNGPTFRVGRAGRAQEDNAVDLSPREIGTIPVRVDPRDAEIVSELSEGAHAPLEVYQLNRWAHT
ncbi:MAG: hypothetical protein ACE5JD_13705, partial [Candidatus Methylomirabilia bacterium]